MKQRFTYLFLILIFCSACEELWMDESPANDPINNFDILWQTVDEKYAFFEFKNINWDSVRTIYRPQVHNSMSQEALFNIMDEMLFTLRDGHVNLFSDFNISRNWEWYLNFPRNFDYNLVQQNYLGNNYYISGPMESTIIDSIGYIYYETFTSPLVADNIDFLIHRFKDLKGIIIDLRDNGGGSLGAARLLASRFADQKRLGYKQYYKSGPAHHEFTGAFTYHVKPKGTRQFTKPLVLLTNRKCYSATSFFVTMMKAFPHVTVIGDRTGGGGGLPVDFELPNGWRYRFSTTITTDANDFNIEDGIDPDIFVDMDETDRQNGIDSILERALQELR